MVQETPQFFDENLLLQDEQPAQEPASIFAPSLAKILPYYDPHDHTITTLILDSSCDLTLEQKGELTKTDRAFLEQFAQCKHLSLSGIGLQSLKNMPVFPNLVELRLSDNLLSGDDLYQLQQYTCLRVLDLSNNQVKDFDHLLSLKNKLHFLKQVKLSANPVQEMPNYRGNFFEKLPTVEILDGITKKNEIGESQSYFEDN